MFTFVFIIVIFVIVVFVIVIFVIVTVLLLSFCWMLFLINDSIALKMYSLLLFSKLISILGPHLR